MTDREKVASRADLSILPIKAGKMVSERGSRLFSDPSANEPDARFCKVPSCKNPARRSSELFMSLSWFIQQNIEGTIYHMHVHNKIIKSSKKFLVIRFASSKSSYRLVRKE